MSHHVLVYHIYYKFNQKGAYIILVDSLSIMKFLARLPSVIWEAKKFEERTHDDRSVFHVAASLLRYRDVRKMIMISALFIIKI